MSNIPSSFLNTRKELKRKIGQTKKRLEEALNKHDNERGKYTANVKSTTKALTEQSNTLPNNLHNIWFATR